MSCLNNHYKDFIVDERTKRLVERILIEYKQLLRWIKNRPNRWGDSFKEDLYQMTLYNVIINTYNRVNNHDYTDEEIIGWGAQSIYKAYLDSLKNLPVNMTRLDIYPHSIDDDYDETGRMEPGHVLVPTEEDENLNRAGDKGLEELIDTLPCGDSTKQAILMMSNGYKQIEAAEALGIPHNTLSTRLKALRESDKFKSWAKLNNINIDSLKL